ncbi:hypothetical protein LTS18_012136 [Coniosporium uncinatum]|uniref:Uncharacterized protein n=1 Tax=Coniosporium uncinatum TaxID=93489 RepID=A0ACC3DJ81_9PEZI|nr:hypothetical protein LTS18_012136 [Coniosporium uncinatum]
MSADLTNRIEELGTKDGTDLISKRRRPRKLSREAAAAAAPGTPRNQSAGGVALPVDEPTEPPRPTPTGQPTSKGGPATATKSSSKAALAAEASRPTSTARPTSKDAPTIEAPQRTSTARPLSGTVPAAPPAEAEAPSSNAPRRKPKKLAKTPLDTAKPASQPITPTTNDTPDKALPLDTEVETIKGRVQNLESQVDKLYERTKAANAKSPRRRGKRSKSTENVQQDGELQTLERELVAAQKELVALGVDPEKVSVTAPSAPPPRPAVVELPRSAVVEEIEEIDVDDVEEIPRSNEPEPAKEDDGRAVTLSGSYKVKLPPYLSMEDVKAIQDGVTSAGNIAKKYASKKIPSTQAQPVNGRYTYETRGSIGLHSPILHSFHTIIL